MKNQNDQIKKLQVLVHEISKSKGFYDNETPNTDGSIVKRLALLHSEISEALEADRDGKHMRLIYGEERKNILKDISEIENDSDFKRTFEKLVKNTFEDELADEAIRLFDLAEFVRMNLTDHILLKIRYNKLRKHKHGGKKY